MNHSFTLDGSDALEQRVDSLCRETVAAVRSVIPDHKLDLVLLGGGYGRGEGGVLRTAEGDEPYNDLEFYVLARGNDLVNRRLYNRKLHESCERLSHAAGVEVECKLLSLGALRSARQSMFYYDLLSGHHCCYGDPALLACCDHHLAAHRIPLHEATRLLMNRCSGLLFALERLNRSNFTRDDADFVGRNIAKARLALGDSLLAARGQYHWSCRERHKRLRKMVDDSDLPNISRLIELHQKGVEFKLHPIRSVETREILRDAHGEVSGAAREVWFWIEKRRLQRNFASPEEYATGEYDKCPETARMKNRLINLRTFGVGGLMQSTYPRARLLNTLPLLLWTDHWPEDAALREIIQHQLAPRSFDLGAIVEAYAGIWRNFN